MVWPQVGWVDIAMLALLLVSTAIGLVRGFTFEVLSLAGWFAAWFACLWFGPLLAPYLPIGEAGSALNRVLAYAFTFFVVLVLWSLAARAVSSFIAATPLRPVDRLSGAVFGLARGLLVLLALIGVLVYTPAIRSDSWRQSRGVAWAGEVLYMVLPWLSPAPAGPREAPAAGSV